MRVLFAAGLMGALVASSALAGDPAATSTGPTPAAAAAQATQSPAGAQAPAAGDSAQSDARSATNAQAPAAATGPQASTTAAPSGAPTVLTLETSPPAGDFKPPSGYRTVKKGFTTLYCKNITPIGSRLPQTYCMTQEQLEELERQAEIDRRTIAERSGTCSGGGCGGG